MALISRQNSYMNIGIIGAGTMGTGLGRLWAKHGHHVMFSYSRKPEKLENLVLEIGSHARSGTLVGNCSDGSKHRVQ